MGTSFCSTATTSTSVGSGGFADEVALEQPVLTSRVVAIKQIVVHRTRSSLQRTIVFISFSVSCYGLQRRGPSSNSLVKFSTTDSSETWQVSNSNSFVTSS